MDAFDTALLADHSAVLHALVLAAVALVVLHRPEDLGAEEPVALRLEGAVVDGFRLLHLPVRPLADLLRRRQRDADGVEGKRILRLLEEIENVLHVISLKIVCGRPSTANRFTPPPFRTSSERVPPLRSPAPSPSAPRPDPRTAAP